MGHYISMVAGVPLGDVLVNDVKAVNISGNECLTTSIRVTGVDGMHTLRERKEIESINSKSNMYSSNSGFLIMRRMIHLWHYHCIIICL